MAEIYYNQKNQTSAPKAAVFPLEVISLMRACMAVSIFGSQRSADLVT
jgi:hypothetical protein